MEHIKGIDAINERLKESLDSDNMEAFDQVYLEFFGKIRTLAFFMKQPIVESLDFSDEERIKFYIYGSTRFEDINSANFRGFRLEELPYLFSEFIKGNKESFYNILLENKDIQKQFSLWFKEYGYIEEDLAGLYPRLFSLESFRKNVLNDNEVVASRFYNEVIFFKSTPPEYAYLIALFDASRDGESEIRELYDAKFSNLLNRDEREELASLQCEIQRRPNLFQIGLEDLMIDFEHCLKQITEDPTYFQVLKGISEKTGLSLETIMKFSSRYDQTDLFKDINKRDNIDEELVEKIRYLSSTGKIKDEEILRLIDNVSLDELKQAEKEDSANIKIGVSGGPHSTTKERIFVAGYDREIISIDTSGEMESLPVKYSSNHEDTIKDIYSSLTFSEECSTAVDRATFAASELSSITLIVEKESCFLIMPSNITEEQKSTLIGMFNEANPIGLVGVTTYDKEKDKEDFWFEGIGVSPDKVLEQLTEVKTVGRSI